MQMGIFFFWAFWHKNDTGPSSDQVPNRVFILDKNPIVDQYYW